VSLNAYCRLSRSLYKGRHETYHPEGDSGQAAEVAPLYAETGGAGGIRTLDRALQPYNGLANRRLQPLGHSSVTADMPDAAAGRKRQISGNGIPGHFKDSRLNPRGSIDRFELPSPDRIPQSPTSRHGSVACPSHMRRESGPGLTDRCVYASIRAPVLLRSCRGIYQTVARQDWV
jgi:hypothetical protein